MNGSSCVDKHFNTENRGAYRHSLLSSFFFFFMCLVRGRGGGACVKSNAPVPMSTCGIIIGSILLLNNPDKDNIETPNFSFRMRNQTYEG